jgi:hypothetical protein
VIPNNVIKNPLKFEIKMFNFRAKNLEDKYYYFVKIIFGSPQFTFLLPISTGPNPKFSFEKTFTYDIEFSKMENTFMELVNLLKT